MRTCRRALLGRRGGGVPKLHRCHKGLLAVVANLFSQGESPWPGAMLQERAAYRRRHGLVPGRRGQPFGPQATSCAVHRACARPQIPSARRFGRACRWCETHPLSPEALGAIAEVKGKALCTAAEKNLSFSLSGAQSLAGPAVAACGTAGSAGPLGESTAKAYRALAQYKLMENAAWPPSACRTASTCRFWQGPGAAVRPLPQSPGGTALEEVKQKS